MVSSILRISLPFDDDLVQHQSRRNLPKVYSKVALYDFVRVYEQILNILTNEKISCIKFTN